MGYESRFVGSIPETYDSHFAPHKFEPYAIELAQRMPPGARHVVELAAGTGRVTRQLLRVLPTDAELLVTDLNEQMITTARRLTANDPRVTWRTADAAALPLPDASADTVVCGFGLMFMPDRLAAMREWRRVLAPGGILLVTVWNDMEKNGATLTLHQHVLTAFAENPPAFFALPFSMGDTHELERLATEAQFRGIRIDTVDRLGESESAAHFAHGLVCGNPLWNQLAERGIDPATLEAEVAASLAFRFGDRPCRTPLSAHVLTAFA